MKNLTVESEKGIKVHKKTVHKLVGLICIDLKLNVKSLEFNFISSESLLQLNKKFMRHNYRTDILTFDYSSEKNNLDGEILISFEDASDNSKKYGVSVDNELLRLIIHGILHLIGYEDSTAVKRKKMKMIEDELVNKFQKFSKGLAIK